MSRLGLTFARAGRGKEAVGPGEEHAMCSSLAIWGRPMNVDQCSATVFLHEPLRRSLASWLDGEDVPSMQRCALRGGHRGQHVGLLDAAGSGRFRWDECG